MKPRYMVTDDTVYVNTINKMRIGLRYLGYRIIMKYRNSAMNSRISPNLISPRLSITVITRAGLKSIGNRKSQRETIT